MLKIRHIADSIVTNTVILLSVSGDSIACCIVTCDCSVAKGYIAQI